MIVYDLSADAVARMIRADLASAKEEPPSPIGQFEFGGCTCGVASFTGRPPWELHTTGDELLHVLSGESRLTVRGADGEESRVLRTGELVIVPRGVWHRNDAAVGVTMLFMTPNTGNSHSWDDPNDR